MLRRLARLALLPAVLALAAPRPARADDEAAPFETRRLVLESIEVVGNRRTEPSTVLLYFPLRPGDEFDSVRLLDAVETLRASELFESVEASPSPGTQRGRVKLVLEVEERGVDFRFGTGYRDLDGWYLIPAQLRADNRLGRGERLRLQIKLGFRLAGIELLFEEPRFGDGRNYWGARAAGFAHQRLYFFDDLEWVQQVDRSGVDVHLGREVARGWTLEVGGGFESVDVDSTGEAHETDDTRNTEIGDRLAFEDLPPGIAAGVRQDDRTRVHAALQYDTRSLRRIAGTPAAGFWGRLRGDGFLSDRDDFGVLTADLRGYRAVLGGVLAARARGGLVGPNAPFYDRFYLGGLYSVRGFPSQSLSPPGGETRFWSTSLEFRGPLVGRPDDPRLAGLLFVDAGDAFTGAGAQAEDVAVSAGWGVRLKVRWLGRLGLDVGVPITVSPVAESFHGNLSLGWNF